MNKPFWYSAIGMIMFSIFLTLAGGCSATRQEQKPLPANKSSAADPVWPGEFDKQQAMWLMWPSEVYGQKHRSTYPVTIEIIKALTPYIPVNIITRSQEEGTRIRELLQQSGYSGDKVKYYVVNHYSIWARDVGPLFIKNDKSQLKVVNFGFNNYSRDGNGGYVNTEKQVDLLTARQLGLPVLHSSLVTEGGGIESNGRGTMMTTESVALARNPGMTKVQIEQEYQRVLGVKKVIWLKKGLAEDDTITTGHIDEIARFANPTTILLAQVMPEDRNTNNYSQQSYLRMEENFKLLQKATDQDGKPFKIIRIPMPPSLYAEGARQGLNPPPVRSYLNYAVSNGVVLFQSYASSNRPNSLKVTEDRVKAVFREVFPGRKVISINAESVNLWGGGIHCITQHMPAR
ncbi:MAG TPA: agmatine deiminase family protein [Bacillota bacterium]|nr:agmatine deiminase family protein [Bacillota bacterium]